MAKHPFRIRGDREPALDIVSYGRRGPGHPERFTPAQVAQVARTVRRVPEALVKVSGGGTTPGAVIAHLKYITRRGQLEIETDDGERHRNSEVPTSLVEDWDLELDAAIDRWDYAARGGRVKQPKLVHNIVLSMPAGTSPTRLLAASRSFAREEFALEHRYAFVLHTDQEHPHVHLVVSAHRIDGTRLNIRKPDLRRWREQFALALRREGVEANATPAQLRGKLSDHRRDGLYRLVQRGESQVEWKQRQRATPATKSETPLQSTSAARVLETAAAVQADWQSTVATLHRYALDSLANEVEQFRRSLKPSIVVESDPDRSHKVPDISAQQRELWPTR